MMQFKSVNIRVLTMYSIVPQKLYVFPIVPNESFDRPKSIKFKCPSASSKMLKILVTSVPLEIPTSLVSDPGRRCQECEDVQSRE